jgi:lysozyme
MRQVNKATIDLIKQFEGFYPNAYHDSIDAPSIDTIGYGTIAYPNGTKVKVGDPVITEQQAEEYLMFEVNQKAKVITPMIHAILNDNQFGALVSFAYNLGEGNLQSSTLLKKINENPKDPSIQLEFDKWIYSNHLPIKGLENRRRDEWKLYSTPII